MFRTNISRALFFVAGTTVFYSPVKAAEQAPATVQVERGRQLFHKTFKSYSCAKCHSIEGTGTAVGPNLKTLGSVVGPRGLHTTIMMAVTCSAQEYQLANGNTFRGIEKAKADGTMEVWDLTKTPAELRKFRASEVTMKPNTTWKHPPTGMGLADQELADIVAYVKAVFTGTPKEVTVEELH